jgi:hypothetical protein
LPKQRNRLVEVLELTYSMESFNKGQPKASKRGWSLDVRCSPEMESILV